MANKSLLIISLVVIVVLFSVLVIATSNSNFYIILIAAILLYVGTFYKDFFGTKVGEKEAKRLELIIQALFIVGLFFTAEAYKLSLDANNQNKEILELTKKQVNKESELTAYYLGEPVDTNVPFTANFWVENTGYRTLILETSSRLSLICNEEDVGGQGSVEIKEKIRNGQFIFDEELNEKRIIQIGDLANYQGITLQVISPDLVVGKKECYLKSTILDALNKDKNYSAKIPIKGFSK